jgi:hypothetical protein
MPLFANFAPFAAKNIVAKLRVIAELLRSLDFAQLIMYHYGGLLGRAKWF